MPASWPCMCSSWVYPEPQTPCVREQEGGGKAWSEAQREPTMRASLNQV